MSSGTRRRIYILSLNGSVLKSIAIDSTEYGLEQCEIKYFLVSPDNEAGYPLAPYQHPLLLSLLFALYYMHTRSNVKQLQC